MRADRQIAIVFYTTESTTETKSYYVVFTKLPTIVVVGRTEEPFSVTCVKVSATERTFKDTRKNNSFQNKVIISLQISIIYDSFIVVLIIVRTLIWFCNVILRLHYGLLTEKLI